MRIKVITVISALIAGLCLTGCNPPMKDLGVFNGHFEAGDFKQAGQFAEGKIKKDNNPSGSDLLWALQLGASQRAQLDHAGSIATFDKAEEMMNHFALNSEVLDTVGSTIVNDNAIPYKGQEYDGIMVNTYKALDFLAGKKPDLARVEFNRALDRQTRAKEHFNEEIRKLEAQLDKEKEKNKTDARAMADNPDVQSVVNANYPNLSQFQPYPDFVNPFTTYMAGVYFLLIGENGRAADLLKETAGMVPDNDYIKNDLVLAEDAASGKVKLENQCWVIFENGLGPTKGETRIDLPLILVSDRVYYTGVALPKLYPRSVAYPYLTIKADDGEHRTMQVADMERVIETEFNKDFKGILMRAIASAAVKTAAQAVLSRKNGDGGRLAAFLVGAYSAATTAADVRIWTALPKDFQVARCAIPKNSPLLIFTPGNTLFEADIPPCRNAIVYIRIINAGASPVCEVLAF
ncbi:MAG: hypothetical protein ABSG97_06870 [Sedimentisphaerales bacterium]|jgi:hypothetical protein